MARQSRAFPRVSLPLVSGVFSPTSARSPRGSLQLSLVSGHGRFECTITKFDSESATAARHCGAALALGGEEVFLVTSFPDATLAVPAPPRDRHAPADAHIAVDLG